MREILYIQAGNLANHVGTHFWNTQEAYFTYGDDEVPLTSHDVSFREGLSNSGEPTYCPRLLVFDHKANFGTLATQQAPFDDGLATGIDEEGSLWNGDIVEHNQGQPAPNEYQSHLEEERLFEGSEEPREADAKDYLVADPPQYWPDFNRVQYAPKTLHPIPSIGIWQDVDDPWGLGQLVYDRYDRENDLIEGPVRTFMEDCDNIQGLQFLNDTHVFGSFTHKFLQSFHDEFMKLPAITFSFLHMPAARHIMDSFDMFSSSNVKAMLNEALCVRSLRENAALSCLLQPPRLWKKESWNSSLDIDLESLFHTSAILSAHIESATIPMRLKNESVDVASFCSQLQGGSGMSFTQLSGLLPAACKESADLSSIYDFSAAATEASAQLFSRRNVCRGLDDVALQSYESWQTLLRPEYAAVSSDILPPYPLPSSFPSFFKSQTRRPTTISVLSCLTTSSSSSGIFHHYARFAESCIKLKAGLDTAEMDDLRELKDEMLALHDLYKDPDEDDREEDHLSEDEES